jgi:peptide-methionine (S)-S-oxide reductase
MKITLAALAILGIASTFGCCRKGSHEETMALADSEQVPAGAKSLVIAGGCFWCIEVLFDELKGVHYAENGYAGGQKPNVTYEEVCMGTTGHAEVIKVVYDPKQVSGEDLLRLFFAVHDPTTLNRQGPDSGTQYRSAIFYSNDEEKAMAEKIRTEIAREKIWPNPIVTTIEPLKNYTRAEEYHQDYFAKFEKASTTQRMGMNAGYCSAIIEPKVRKFREKYAEKLKKKG